MAALTQPQTAAGRALLAVRGSHQGGWFRNDVLAIEAESAAQGAAQERERIRAAAKATGLFIDPILDAEAGDQAPRQPEWLSQALNEGDGTYKP